MFGIKNAKLQVLKIISKTKFGIQNKQVKGKNKHKNKTTSNNKKYKVNNGITNIFVKMEIKLNSLKVLITTGKVKQKVEKLKAKEAIKKLFSNLKILCKNSLITG